MRRDANPDPQPVPHRGSLPEVHRSVSVHCAAGFWRRWLAFAGPAYLISVGYMDPGNWATDLEGGSRFGYRLLWVLLMSNAMAVLLQTLSARLGVVTGKDLAQACREAYPRPVVLALWILCEVAIAACDLAEVLGTAIALNLLIGIPLTAGVLITAADVFLLLAVQRFGIRKMEAMILAMVALIGLCYVVEVILAKPAWGEVLAGFRPSIESPQALYIAIGILGATVMPHNLYLHSALVQTRAFPKSGEGIRRANLFNFVDSAVALNGAFFVNAAILVLAAATFHRHRIVVTEIQQAHQLLAPLLGTGLAGVAFAVALLCAGQSSTITGTLAGQVVMEGFLRLRMRPWLRRVLTRTVAIVPAVAAVAVLGDEGTYQLLILSQVILSLQLPFAVIPLVQFTSDPDRMGSFASPRWVRAAAWSAAAVVVGLNGWLVFSTLSAWLGSSAIPLGVRILVTAAIVAISLLVAYVTLHPWVSRRRPRPRAAEAAVSAEGRGEAPTYRRIVIALGADAADARLLEHGLALAKAHDAEVVLVHVADGVGPTVHGTASDDRETREDRNYLEAAGRRAEAAGLRAETRLLFGHPAAELVRAVEGERADLLVMGAHGHTVLGDLFFGSTVTPVRHRVRVPVLVVRRENGKPRR